MLYFKENMLWPLKGHIAEFGLPKAPELRELVSLCEPVKPFG